MGISDEPASTVAVDQEALCNDSFDRQQLSPRGMPGLFKWSDAAGDYSSLDNDDKHDSDSSSDDLLDMVRKQRSLLRKWRLITLACASATLIIILLNVVQINRARALLVLPALSGPYLPCGDTTSTALRRSCAYHPLSHSWLPRECNLSVARDAVTLASDTGLEGQDTAGQFWLDKKGTQEVTGDDWDSVEMVTPVWTTQRHHVTHCVYLLAQAAAAVSLGGMMEENARKWEHQHLCIQTIMKAAARIPGWDERKGNVQVGSGSCW